MSQQIRVSFKAGQVSMETEGFKGPACKPVMDEVLKKLQLKPISESPTDDFHKALHTEVVQEREQE